MVKIERSAHVKDQLRKLEQDVLQAKKHFNCLRNERERKEAMLTRMSETHGILLITDEATQSSDRISELQSRLERALAQLERETAMTETLEHMLVERRKAIAARAQPTVPMQRKLIAEETIKSGNLLSLVQKDLDLKANQHHVKMLKQQFIERHRLHEGALETLLEKYSHRKEFVELAEAHRAQQHLRSQLLGSESELAVLQNSLRACRAVEQKQKDSLEKRAALEKMEKTIRHITTAAKADSPEGILAYWSFLTDSEEYLRLSAALLEEKITSSQQRLEECKREYAQTVGSLAENSVPAIGISMLEEKKRDIDQTLELRRAKVPSRQLQWFTNIEARLKTSLTHLLEGIGVNKVADEESPVRLVEMLENGLIAMV